MTKLRLFLCTTLLTISSGLFASEIYKWTDSDGNVHYGDRPTASDQANFETVAVASRRTNPSQVQAGIDARQERDAARAEARDARAKADEDARKAQADAEERSAKCDQYRARLEEFLTSRRLYRVDDAGERNYLDEVQIQEARSKAQQKVEEYCSPG